MRGILLTSLAILISLVSCQQNNDQQNQLSALKTELLQAKSDLVKAETPPTITHLVYLDTKENIDISALKAELTRLGDIPGVANYQIGAFLDLGDPRAMAQNELILTMGFDNQEAYQNYQNHPIHLDVKAKLGPYLARPPVTYDFE